MFMLSYQNNEKIPDCRTAKRLLGQILVDGDFIPSSALEAAVKQQKKTNDLLGEVLIRMGVLDPGDLKAVLSIQKDLATFADAVKAAAGVRLLLGELFIKAKRITQEQLDYALREQQVTGEKLGEVLTRLGLLTDGELDAVLAFQRHQCGEAPASEKFRLGELLVVTGQVTRDQLEDVLNRQKFSKKKIGDLLIEAGYVKPHQVAQGLKLQQKLVTAALVAALSLSPVCGVTKAYCQGQTAKVTITATVREHTSMQVLSQAKELVITSTDIQRGYVEVPQATRINVMSNSPAGYLLVFEVMPMPDSLFDAVSVSVGGREVQLPPNGGWIPQSYVRGGVTQDVTYHFALSKSIRPGTYGWPIAISTVAR